MIIDVAGRGGAGGGPITMVLALRGAVVVVVLVVEMDVDAARTSRADVLAGRVRCLEMVRGARVEDRRLLASSVGLLVEKTERRLFRASVEDRLGALAVATLFGFGLLAGAGTSLMLESLVSGFAARLSRALLVAVALTIGAELLRTGRALNAGFLSWSSSMRLRRSSFCSLSLRAMASPGSSKVERVGGFVDFAGWKGALVTELTRLAGGFPTGLVDPATEDVDEVIGPASDAFLAPASDAFSDAALDSVIDAGGETGFLVGIFTLSVGLFVFAAIDPVEGRFRAAADNFVASCVTSEALVAPLCFLVLPASRGSSVMAGISSPTFSIASSNASIASTESSIRDPCLTGVRFMICSMNEPLLSFMRSSRGSWFGGMPLVGSMDVIFAGLRESMASKNESSSQSSDLGVFLF